jgi:ribonuclease R
VKPRLAIWCLAELTGNAQRKSARVTQVLGDPFAPKSFSLIAIHKYGIPFEMPEADRNAKRARAGHCRLPVTADHREDLRHLPIIAIDPRDARDFDDAIWAAPNAETGGFDAIVAIADVSYYVRPGSALDREAVKRGNSVYFPDLVVPMLPHALSSDKCSLRAGEDRAVHCVPFGHRQDRPSDVMAFHPRCGPDFRQYPISRCTGRNRRTRWKTRLLETALKPLWACWRSSGEGQEQARAAGAELCRRNASRWTSRAASPAWRNASNWKRTGWWRIS